MLAAATSLTEDYIGIFGCVVSCGHLTQPHEERGKNIPLDRLLLPGSAAKDTPKATDIDTSR